MRCDRRFPKAVRTEGAYIFTADGRRIVDAISSWWVITHGHRHPRIVAAIRAAADTLDQVIFAEYTHELGREAGREAARGGRRPASRMSFSPTAARPASKSR